MVEIEIGVLHGQCLTRRIGERNTLIAKIDVWKAATLPASRSSGCLTTSRARDKRARAYPQRFVPDGMLKTIGSVVATFSARAIHVYGPPNVPALWQRNAETWQVRANTASKRTWALLRASVRRAQRGPQLCRNPGGRSQSRTARQTA
jgi:hypothetical protein